MENTAYFMNIDVTFFCNISSRDASKTYQKKMPRMHELKTNKF